MAVEAGSAPRNAAVMAAGTTGPAPAGGGASGLAEARAPGSVIGASPSAVAASSEAEAPSLRSRLTIALALGLATALYVIAREVAYPQWGADIVQSWAGSWVLRRGGDPYTAIGPQGTFMHWPWPLFYPLPALILTLPFTVLPVAVFRPVFLGLSGGWLAYATTRRHYWGLLMFTSAAFLGAIQSGAWEPLLVAAALTPGTEALYLAKPNVGLALGTALVPRRATVVGLAIGVVLLAVTFVVRPGWLPEWREALRAGTHLGGPIGRPGGFLVLAALARWRRADARLLVAMACVPQSMILQAALPLFLVTRTRIEMMLLALLTYIPYAVQLHFAAQNMLFPGLTERTGNMMALFLYLPCTAMVLRRPNRWAALDGSQSAVRAA